jgi:putative toxin-antitoxin system antitoxin component (TIGR02293 family)
LKDLEKDLSVRIINKNLSFSDFLQNKMLIIHSIKRGFPFCIFKQIKLLTPFTEAEWAEFLNISVKSLQRYKNEKSFYFKSIHTGKMIEIAEVVNFGSEIFDTPNQFEIWLKTPSITLDNLKPSVLLKESYGKELVMAELNRIDQGIFV